MTHSRENGGEEISAVLEDFREVVTNGSISLISGLIVRKGFGEEGDAEAETSSCVGQLQACRLSSDDCEVVSHDSAPDEGGVKEASMSRGGNVFEIQRVNAIGKDCHWKADRRVCGSGMLNWEGNLIRRLKVRRL